jgi:2-oxoisovalerate dehydrogenase E1 component
MQPPPSRDVLLAIYRTMHVIRQTEEELARSHQRGLIHGACHTYVGQEAIAAGVCANLTKEDVVFSTHRGHGHALAQGMPPRELIAELFGRATGCSRGRGGSMHLFSPEIGMMGTSGIVGPCILQACGGGYSSKLMRTGRVAVAFFGDGAVNNGAFHEGLNMASIWKLPVLFVCENNQFATEVPFQYASGIADVGRRAANYGLAGFEVDGNDAAAVFQVAREAVARARTGGGATLIECKTYRTRAHAEGMGDFTYRTRDEVNEWKCRCPIASLRQRLVTEFDVAESQLERIASEVAALVADARRFAESSPWPDAATAIDHVYSANCDRSSFAPREDERGVASTSNYQQAASVGSTPVEQTAGLSRSEKATTREITFSQATHEALSEELAANPAIFVMGEGIGKRGGNFNTTAGLFAQFGPERLCDTPICERGFVGLACGAAMTGTRPVVDFIFADFVLDSVGEIINQIAKMQYMSSGRLTMPVLLRGCIGIGHSAATHHSGSYYGSLLGISGRSI